MDHKTQRATGCEACSLNAIGSHLKGGHACTRVKSMRTNLNKTAKRAQRGIPSRQKAGIDVFGAGSVALHHLLTTSAWRPFWKCASSKTASAAGRTGRYLSCERAQTVCRKRGGGRPRKNGRGGGSPAATRRPRHLVTLGPRPCPADQSVMHVSLSKYLRKAAPTPPGLAPFFFAPVINMSLRKRTAVI